MSRQGSNPSLYLTSEVLIPLYYKMLLDLRFNFLFKEKKTIKIKIFNINLSSGGLINSNLLSF